MVSKFGLTISIVASHRGIAIAIGFSGSS